MKKIIVLGGGGFIGSHLVSYLKDAGNYVVAVDIKRPAFKRSTADKFILQDLRDQRFAKEYFEKNTFDEVYQLAADMGGAGYVFTGEHDADIMHNSIQINVNILDALKNSSSKVFYASSACIYPEENQLDFSNPNCAENSAFPANPDSEYGWEKLFSERMFLAYARNYNLDIRIARFHNIYGPYGEFSGGREKAPAAICRKVALAKDNDQIEVWGAGNQTRSFLYIDECLEGVAHLMDSDYRLPVNIGSDEMVSINELTNMVIQISGKTLIIKNVAGPKGVNGRCSDNQLISTVLGWQPNYPLRKGMEHLFSWVNSMV